MLDSSKTYGIRVSFGRLGNTLAWTHLPENYFRRYGRKLVDLGRLWAFDHNPYVERDGRAVDAEFDLSSVDIMDNLYWQLYGRHLPVALSRADEDCVRLGISEVTLRHPRLYRYEDLPTVPGKVILHVASDNADRLLPPFESARRVMPGHVIARVLERYSECPLFQVGSERDPPVDGVTDLRGLPPWETARHVAESALFIGVDSGPMNLAACYPRVPRKVVLAQFDTAYLRTSFYPMNTRFKHHQWLDWGTAYFNCSEDDAGVTYSYLKI